MLPLLCLFLLIATAAHTILVMTTNSITSSNSSPVVIVAMMTEEEISVRIIYSDQITLMYSIYIHAAVSVTVGETLLCTVVCTEELTAMDVSIEEIVNSYIDSKKQYNIVPVATVDRDGVGGDDSGTICNNRECSYAKLLSSILSYTLTLYSPAGRPVMLTDPLSLSCCSLCSVLLMVY